MLITNPCVVSLTWKLRDTQGELLDELLQPVEFFVGGHDLLPKVEEALLNQEVGFTTTLHLEPDQAFGEYDAKLVFFEDRALLPQPLEVGLQFEGVPPGAATQGLPQDMIYTLTEIYPEHVVLDGNHPLAGIALRVELLVHQVREAGTSELAAQTSSGSDAHHELLKLAPHSS
jgi:FKBP-type peptidyl-prolyl cis-trans isomerase SlyD